MSSSPVLLTVIGLTLGVAIGLAAFDARESGQAPLSRASAEAKRLISGSMAKLGDTASPTVDAAGTEATALCIANVHDGDTIRTCQGERIRIENIDAPELPGSPKCTEPGRQGWCDYALAETSRDELARFLGSGPVTASRSGTDRYGRTLATLSVNGQDAGYYLVSKGLARVWQ